jgi:4a-hydroxytetrahydrobiopterin dehydratase
MHVLDLMSEYFDSTTGATSINENTMQKFTGWEKVASPERLIRDYDFASRPMALEFLRQLLLYEDAVNHHAKIVIDYDHVRVEVYTHDIDAVTERDVEYADSVDQIYMDTNYTCQNI